MAQEIDDDIRQREQIEISGLQRFIAFLFFFFVSVPMILFVIGVVYQLWELVQGRGILVDTWTVLSVLPLGIIISPVSFYLGWYFQARAKNQQFDLNRAMGGHFLGFCRALYGILAAITILLAIIGALGSFYIDSRLLLVCWIGIAFVGIGIVSWLFQDTGEPTPHSPNQSVSLKPTGVAFIVFSLLWFYLGILGIVHQDQEQLEGSATLFLIFLIMGIIAFRLSDRRPSTPSSEDNN